MAINIFLDPWEEEEWRVEWDMRLSYCGSLCRGGHSAAVQDADVITDIWHYTATDTEGKILFHQKQPPSNKTVKICIDI